MRKKSVCLLFTSTVIALFAVAAFAQEATLNRSAVAKAIAERMCIKIVPDINTLPQEQHYEIYANALAARGVGNFVGTNPQDVFTVGELKQIYDIISAGKAAEIAAANADCPLETAAVLGLSAQTGLTAGHLNRVLGCFPACDLTAEPYVAPVVPTTPGIPETTPEEPSSQIE